MSASKVAVVILNFNGKHWLEKFLPSVVKHTPTDLASIIVADNGSSDDSLCWLEENYPELSCLDLKKNWGFAQGYNRALQMVEAQYYVLLNSDVEVSTDWLTPLVNLMESNPKIGACQPKIKSFHQKTHFEYAGAAGGWLDRYGYPFCRGRIFDTLEADENQYPKAQEIFWASGACLMIRAELYHQLGGLDSDFFAHMEEIDLCWRIQNAGFELWYSPESMVYHVGGGTLQTGSPFKTYLNFRNNLVMLLKNLPREKLWLTVLWRMVLDGIAGLKFLFSGEFKHFWAVFRAHGFLYGNIFTLLSKRKQVQEVSPAKPLGKLKGFYPKSIVWTYFGRKKKTFREL